MKHAITGTALRRARDIANLSLGDLAYLAGVSKSNLSRIENSGDAPIKCHRTTVRSIVAVLKLNGVELSAEGVRSIPKEFANGKAHEGRTIENP